MQLQVKSETDKKHRKYSKISLQKRKLLVQLVVEKGESLTRTAKRINIKLSTAKLILRKFRKTGLLFNKNMGVRGKKPQAIPQQRKYQAQQQNICEKQQLEMLQSSQSPEPVKKETALEATITQANYYGGFGGSWIVYPNPWAYFPFAF